MSGISPVSFASCSEICSTVSTKPLALTALALLTLSNLPKATADRPAFIACFNQCWAEPPRNAEHEDICIRFCKPLLDAHSP